MPTVGFSHAEVLHLAHEVRQRGLGRRGREDEEELAGQVLAQPPHGDAAEDAGDGTEYEEDEEETRDVERQHEDSERLHGIEAGGANHAGHGAERADGCDPEDHRQQLEHEAMEVRNEREDGLTRRSHGLHGEAAEQRDEENLEHRARRKGREQRVRDDGRNEAREALVALFCLSNKGIRSALRGRDVQTGAWLDVVTHEEAHGEREGRHNDEVRQGDAAGLAHRGCGTHGADAEHDGTEDDRGNNHRDEAHEHRAEDLKRRGGLRRDEAENHATDDRDDDSNVEPVRAVLLRTLRLSNFWGGGSWRNHSRHFLESVSHSIAHRVMYRLPHQT